MHKRHSSSPVYGRWARDAGPAMQGRYWESVRHRQSNVFNTNADTEKLSESLQYSGLRMTPIATISVVKCIKCGKRANTVQLFQQWSRLMASDDRGYNESPSSQLDSRMIECPVGSRWKVDQKVPSSSRKKTVIQHLSSFESCKENHDTDLEAESDDGPQL